MSNFLVCCTSPIYGSRDEYVGSRIFPHESLPAYETKGLALRKASLLNEENWSEEDGYGIGHYSVYELPGWRRVTSDTPHLGDQDIPF